MKAAFAAFLVFSAAVHAAPITIQKRSVSTSRQFVVYCDNLEVRLAVTGFAEETKAGVLNLLGQADGWKVPVVIELRRDLANDARRPASTVAMSEIEEGFKIEVQVGLERDPRETQLQQQIVRAILLEFAYRDSPNAVRAGTPYLEPPAWLVAGLAQTLQSRQNDDDASVFRSLIAGGKLPSLPELLNQKFDRLDSTSRQLYRMYAMSLVHLLIERPEGRASIAKILRALPEGEDATAGVMKAFPILAGEGKSVEKWWALGVARLSATDRYKGFSMAETERKLVPLLSLELTSGKSGAARKFELGEFKTYLKNPASRTLLKQTATALSALGATAHPLFRPIIYEYQLIASNLARGKTRRITARLNAATKYRELVLQKMDQIADYMNWFEATRVPTRSTAFDDYLKSARDLTATDTGVRRDDAISRYLDQMSEQYRGN